jgi:hypothetical protein
MWVLGDGEVVNALWVQYQAEPALLACLEEALNIQIHSDSLNGKIYKKAATSWSYA